MQASVNITHCHECAADVHLPNIRRPHKVFCPRCGNLLTVIRYQAIQKTAIFSLTALIFLMLSLPFEFISFSAAGKTQAITIPSGLVVLVENNYLTLAIIESFFIIFAPGLALSAIFLLTWRILKTQQHDSNKRLAHFIFQLLPWCMAEIFLISVLVSLVKIVTLADIAFGPSFFTFCAFVLFSTLSLLYLDEHQIRTITGARLPAHFHSHSTNTQKTWALLITAGILYIPANVWPIMETNVLGQSELSTILGGVILLWESGSYPIAIIILVASVVVPVAKLVILCWLNHRIQSQNVKHPRKMIAWYRLTELIGKWSMVDVFVVAILVSLVQLGGTMSIYPGPAALSFSAVVVLTMLAAHNFDSTLLWKDKSR